MLEGQWSSGATRTWHRTWCQQVSYGHCLRRPPGERAGLRAAPSTVPRASGCPGSWSREDSGGLRPWLGCQVPRVLLSPWGAPLPAGRPWAQLRLGLWPVPGSSDSGCGPPQAQHWAPSRPGVSQKPLRASGQMRARECVPGPGHGRRRQGWAGRALPAGAGRLLCGTAGGTCMPVPCQSRRLGGTRHVARGRPRAGPGRPPSPAQRCGLDEAPDGRGAGRWLGSGPSGGLWGSGACREPAPRSRGRRVGGRRASPRTQALECGRIRVPRVSQPPRGPLPRKGRPCGATAAEAPGQEGKTKQSRQPRASAPGRRLGSASRGPGGGLWTGCLRGGLGCLRLEFRANAGSGRGSCWQGTVRRAGAARRPVHAAPGHRHLGRQGPGSARYVLRLRSPVPSARTSLCLPQCLSLFIWEHAPPI